jgi:putative NADH-flavin reductase
MKLAVFGATGLAGGATVQLAHERGHQVRALVRRSTTPPTAIAGAELIRGDAFDPQAVAQTVTGADAVVSTLGGFRGPESIDVGTANIITAMRAAGLDRLVVLQGFHIGFPGDPHNPGKRLIEAFLALRCRPLIGHGAALGELLRGTDDLSWTLVRIPPIVKRPASGRAKLGIFGLGPWSCVHLGDIGEHLIDAVEHGTSVRAAPMLCTPRTLRRSAGRTGTSAATSQAHT